MNSTKNLNEKVLFYLQKNNIFSSADGQNLVNIIDMGYCNIRRYSRGDMILSPTDIEKRVILIVSGSADVYSSKKGEGVMLRKLCAGNMSGVSNLFGDSAFESYIIAHERTEMLEISVEGIKYLIENDRGFTYSYISFLSGRICYLNKKIKYITAQTPEGALARYLDSVSEGDDFILPLPMNSIADILNIGRASLYRAMDTLVNEGLIQKNGKNILILNRQKMLESYL